MGVIKNYKVLTVTYRQASLKELGEFVIPETAILEEQLNAIREKFGFKEIMYLATCNRVLYLFSCDEELDHEFAVSFFRFVNPNLSKNSIQKVETFACLFQGEKALEHLYSVASSIDSLVVGEREIFRQIREAYEGCNKLKTTGDDIRLLIRYMVKAAKEVYEKTRIGEKPVSVVSLAVSKLLEYQLDTDSRFIMVGAGQTNNLLSKFLLKHDYTQIAVFNRNKEKAQLIADRFDQQAYQLDELKNYRKGFDVLIVCTGATKAIIDADMYEKLCDGNRDTKLILDLSVPSNVSSEVLEKFSPNYIEIEDLRSLAKENLAFRQHEVAIAREIIAEHLGAFKKHYKGRQLEKALGELPVKIKAVKARAVNEVFKKEIDELDDSTKELVERMMSYMEKKCIGIPMQIARKNVIED